MFLQINDVKKSFLCSIISFIGSKKTKEIVLNGLIKFKYCGYNSARINLLIQSIKRLTSIIMKVVFKGSLIHQKML